MLILQSGSCPFYDDAHTERLERPGSFYHTFEFTIPADHPSAAYAVPKGLVTFSDPDNIIKAFVIQEVEHELTADGATARIYAEDAAQDELNSLVLVGDSFTGQQPSAVAQSILSGSRWELGRFDSPLFPQLITHTFENYETVWEALLWLSERTGLMLTTEVAVSGSAITKRLVSFVRARGRWTGKVLTYQGDVINMRRHGEATDLATALYGVGPDGMTFASVTWSRASGDPTDKPSGRIYVEDNEATLRWGIPIGGTMTPRFAVYRDDDAASPTDLLERTWERLTAVREPAFTYECDIVALENLDPYIPGSRSVGWGSIRIGDTVAVRDLTLGDEEPRLYTVTEVTRSYADRSRERIVLGVPSLLPLSSYLRQAIKAARR